MTTMITITRHFQIPALLDIQNAEFAHWYELGAFWAMYGDEQGKGPYADSYLITNIIDRIRCGRYHNLLSPRFPSLGFCFGMIHGGVLSSETKRLRVNASTLVCLRDPNFTRGYRAAREWYFFEAEPQELRSTDGQVVERINEYAIEHTTYHEPRGTLCYSLGGIVGKLSGQVFPMLSEERERIEENNRQILAAYEKQLKNTEHTPELFRVVAPQVI